MTVLIKKIPKAYQSLGGSGSTEEDRKKADRLDELLEGRIQALLKDLEEQELMPRQAGKGSILTYWMLGRTLREVAVHRELFDEAELPLLWQNAKLYIPEKLLYRKRGPYREHLWYCYRLGSYPKGIAERMNWGEWVTIFDSMGINQEPRFDDWFVSKLSKEQTRISREQIRIFAPSVNTMLGNVDIQELSDSELTNCYEACWSIMKQWFHYKQQDEDYGVGRKEIQVGINELLGKLDLVMAGELPPEMFADEVVTSPADVEA